MNLNDVNFSPNSKTSQKERKYVINSYLYFTTAYTARDFV